MALKCDGNGKIVWMGRIVRVEMSRGISWRHLVFDYVGRVLPSLGFTSQLMLQCYSCTMASISYFL